MAVSRLAGEQHGVVSRSQLRELGLTDREIAVRVRQGHLHPLFHATFAVGHRAVTRPGFLLAATLACEEGTALSHGSAAELLGLWNKQLATVHVISPNWSGRKIPDIRWHRVRIRMRLQSAEGSRARRSPAPLSTWPENQAGPDFEGWSSRRLS